MKYLTCLFGVIFLATLINSVAPSHFCSSKKPNGTTYPATSNIYNGSISECGCKATITCVRKCCDVGYILINRTCVFNNTIKLEIPVYKNSGPINSSLIDFLFIPGLVKCAQGTSIFSAGLDTFQVQDDGRLWDPDAKELLNHDQYCLEHFMGAGEAAFVCVDDVPDLQSSETAQKLNFIGMTISLPFLLLTFLVYAILPDRNLHGMCLMSYVLTLFMAYLLLILIQLYSKSFNCPTCRTTGLLCMFFFMVSFFWINVMSIDICWTFSGSRGFSQNKKGVEQKYFLLYSCYAWGVPLLLAVLVGILNSRGFSSASYYPGIGDGQCWFRDGFPTLLYFYGPITLILITNIILFGITALKIKRVQQETAVLRTDENKKHYHESNKKRFILFLKLLLIMGINWSLEIISWAVNWQIGHVPPVVWYVGDFLNALYGVIIFFIFVFKKSVWKSLQKRYCMILGKPYLASSTT